MKLKTANAFLPVSYVTYIQLFLAYLKLKSNQINIKQNNYFYFVSKSKVLN